ncbi:MAG: hypothetical protein DRH17_09120 [Deltaproteobacteria bacterium]|nr:MAG: hypothetical protein DRH17_09120 [Deltaproteobacteria bacterium]
MRLLILGLDALDPILVEKWNMDWFKQRVYGRHYVGFLKKLYTPIVWGCFATGKNVEELGYNLDYIHEKRNRKLFGFLYPLYVIRKKLLPNKNLGIRNLLIKLGILKEIAYTPNMPEIMRHESFIEVLISKGYRVYAHEVPGYNEEHNEYYRTSLAKAVEQPFNERKKLVEEALEDTRKRVEKGLKYVIDGYDLVFVYSPLPDIAFHVVLKPTLRMKLWLREVHYKLYNTVKPLLDAAYSNGYAVLIVSDHGFDIEKYYHSDYGFWSLNINPPSWWKIRSILDFKNNILRLVTEV